MAAPVISRRYWNDPKVSERCITTPTDWPKVYPKFQKVFDKDTGFEVVKAVGFTQSYQAIQDAAEDTLLYTLLDKFSRGETDLADVRQREAAFVDLVGCPSSLMEAMNAAIDSKNFFNSLPMETREKFNNNVNEWLKDLDVRGRRKHTLEGSATPQPTPEPPQPTPAGGDSQ